MFLLSFLLLLLQQLLLLWRLPASTEAPLLFVYWHVFFFVSSMATTSVKHDAFVRENMKDAKTGEYKPAIALAGIGEKSAADLKAVGFTQAYHVLVHRFCALESQ